MSSHKKVTFAEMTHLASVLGIEPTQLPHRHLRLLAVLLPSHRWVPAEDIYKALGWGNDSLRQAVKEIRPLLPLPWYLVNDHGKGYALVLMNGAGAHDNGVTP